jgi:Xaa-Pro aminopeptidase
MVAVAIFSAYHYVTGKKPAKTEATEFAVAGQLADMGPVKALIEQTGLLVQQQVRTNMHLEATAKAQEEAAKALTKFADTYEHRMEDEQREKEIAEEVERRLRERGGS